MKVTEMLVYAWLGITVGSALDFLYQYFFTESVNYVSIGGFWLAMTAGIVILLLMFLEDEEKQKRESKIKQLEKRVEKLEEGEPNGK